MYKINANTQWLNLHDYKDLQQFVYLYSVSHVLYSHCIHCVILRHFKNVISSTVHEIKADRLSTRTRYEIILLRTDIARIQQPCNKVARQLSRSNRGGSCIIRFGMAHDGKMRDKHCHLPELNQRRLSGGWAERLVVSIHSS